MSRDNYSDIMIRKLQFMSQADITDIEGADSSKICNRCPYGYFNDKEGQSRCITWPNDISCSSEIGDSQDLSYSSESY